jgi:hypothetical protein
VPDSVFQRFINDGARRSVADAMKACFETATTSDDKKACASSSAKEALKASLGKDDVPAINVRLFVQDGARDVASEAMTSCIIAAGSNQTKSYACKTTAVKATLKAALGRVAVSDADVERFVASSAADAAAKAMKAAMQTTGSTQEAKEAAAKAAVKEALLLCLGKDNVSNVKLHEVINAGAQAAVGDAMGACVDVARTNRTKMSICRTSTAKEILAKSLGKPASSIDQADVENTIRRAAEEKIARLMEAASLAKPSGTSASKEEAFETERREITKTALKEALGKPVITDTDLEVFVEAGAKSVVKSVMVACASSAEEIANTTLRQEAIEICREHSAKDALKSSLGKSIISDGEVEAFVRQGAQEALVAVMKAGMEDTTSSPAQRQEYAKMALQAALGKTKVDDVTFEYFKAKGAESASGHSMNGCMSAATLELDPTKKDTQQATCFSQSAKEALKNALGVANVDSAEVHRFVSKAGKTSAARLRKACMTVAGDDTAKQAKCRVDREELKSAIEMSAGLSSVSDSMAESFVIDGAQKEASDILVACFQTASGDAAKLEHCRKEARVVINLARGTELPAGEIEQMKEEGGGRHVLDMMKACYNSAPTKDEQEKCWAEQAKVRASVEEALGKRNVDPSEIPRFKRMAMVNALQQSNEGLEKASGMTPEEKRKSFDFDMNQVGMNGTTSPLALTILYKRAGAMKVATTAVACQSAGVGPSGCDVAAERAKAVGVVNNRRLSSVIDVQIQREGAEEVLKRHIYGESSSDEGVLFDEVACAGCKKAAGLIEKLLNKKGCTWFTDLEAGAICEAAGLGPEDPGADACAAAVVWGCPKLMKLIEKKVSLSEHLCKTVCQKPPCGDGSSIQGELGGIQLVSVPGYDVLRNPKYCPADVYTAKAKIAGEYVLDCQEAGKTFSECKISAESMLKEGLKSDDTIDSALARAQFEMLSATSLCSSDAAETCNKEAATSASKLGLQNDEIKARRTMAAIPLAATTKADCLDSGNTESACMAQAKVAYEQLSFGYSSASVQNSINSLAQLKMNGEVTVMKTLKSVTTVALYNGGCDERISKSIQGGILDDLIAGEGKPDASSVDATSNINGKCELIISTTFPEETADAVIRTSAANVRSTFSTNTRRRLTAVESSSSATVREVARDANVDRNGAEKEESPMLPPWVFIVLGGAVCAAVCAAVIALYKYAKKEPTPQRGEKERGRDIPVVAMHGNSIGNPIYHQNGSMRKGVELTSV